MHMPSDQTGWVAGFCGLAWRFACVMRQSAACTRSTWSLVKTSGHCETAEELISHALAAAVTVPPSSSMAFALSMQRSVSALTSEDKPANLFSWLNAAPMNPTLQERMAEVMGAMNWEHADVMRVSGQSSSVVSQWLGKGSKIIKTIGKMEAAEAIERESGYSALWVAKGLGPKFRQVIKNDDPKAVAQSVSQARPMMTLQEVTFEGLPVTKLDVPFQMKLPGDELMPIASRGETGLFMPDKQPKPGRGVLLKDKAGNFYLRLFGEGIGGNWVGYSNQPGIPTLERDTHGVEVVAPMIGSF